MTDQELLELAARSIGLDISNNAAHWSGEWFIFYAPRTKNWNPLIDDGDALRLAENLGLRVFPFASTANGYACSAVSDGANTRLSDVVATGDVCADVRRAIVLAAAEIGRTMP